MKWFMVFLMAMLSSFSTASAEGAKLVITDSVRVTGYALGHYKSNRAAVEVDLGDTTVKYMIIGYADGNLFGSCGKNQACSDLHNQTLAELRASMIARALKERGINSSRISARGEISNSRGAEYRGVTVYVLHEVVTTPAPTVVRETRNDKVSDSLNTLSKNVASLKDSLARVAHEVESFNRMLKNVYAEQGEPKQEEHSKQSFANLDVGVGFGGMKAKGGVDSFTPTLSLFIKPRMLPFELMLEGGYRPQASSNVCNRADVSGALGVHIPVHEPIGITGGIFTDRESCTDGGPKLTERWLERTNGIYFGMVSGVDVGKRFRLDINPALTWGQTIMAEGGKKSSGLGFRAGLEIRTHNKH